MEYNKGDFVSSSDVDREDILRVEKELKSFAESAADFIITVGKDGRIIYVNKSADDVSVDEVLGSNIYANVPGSDRDELQRRMDSVFNSGTLESCELIGKGVDGAFAWYFSRICPINRDGRVVAAVIISTDITARKKVEELLKKDNHELKRRVKDNTAKLTKTTKLLRREIEARIKTQEELFKKNSELEAITVRLKSISHIDPVTDSLNSKGLQESLSLEVKKSEKNNSSLMAMLINLDNFKKINDLFGHGVGDVVLKDIVAKLRKTLRKNNDYLGRIGADEFIVLLPRTDFAESFQIAEKVRLSISGNPIYLSDGEPVKVTASLAVESITKSTPSLDELLSKTRRLLRLGRVNGKNQVFYDETNLAPRTKRQQFLSSLLASIGSGDCFSTFIQPIVTLEDMKTVGYEMLSRTTINSFEMPVDFFRVCYEANVLTLVDHQCFKSCVAAADKLPKGIRRHINLFPSTIIDIPTKHLIEEISAIGGMDKEYCIEISEQQIIGDPSYIVGHVRDIKKAGIKVAIDDIGFGRSCLESLVLLEPDIVKIDKKCVIGIGSDKDPDRARAIEKIVKMISAIGAEVIAEGIETEDDLRLLQSMNVRYGQGYFIGRPAPQT